MNLFQIRNHYRTGNISVYPLVVKSENPKAGKLKIVSGRKSGKWMETDHYGDRPMNSWEDVLEYLQKQIDQLSKLNALSYISRQKVIEYWMELNTPSKIINAPDPDDVENIRLTENGIDSIITYIDDSQTNPRFQPRYWEPILTAWKSSFEKVKTEHEKGKLFKL